MTQPHSGQDPAATGLAHHRAGNLDQARAIYAQLLRQVPDHPGVNYLMGRLAWDRGDLDGAVRHLETAREGQPEVAELHEHLAFVYTGRNDLEAALAAYDRALALRPDSVATLGYRGNVLQLLGRLDEAMASFRRGVAVDARAGAIWENLSMHKTFTPDDPDVDAMRAALDRLPATDPNVVAFHFALGKARHDQGDHPRAFAHYAAGNAGRRADVSYNVRDDEAFFDSIRREATADRLTSILGTGLSDPTPVFILGMPRSGSSLVEQILAAHPSVQPGGERLEMVNTVVKARLSGMEDRGFPDWLAGVRPAHVQNLARAYLNAIPRLAAGRHRFTDKMPANFRFVGLIRAMFPNAAIIHIHRTPADNCLSCFMQNFPVSIDYSFDQRDLGRFYAAYSRLIGHWRTVLPAGSFLDVCYEDLVGNPEREIARMLDHCGLTWDDRCTRFYELDRPVHTASIQQVRNPIYKNAVARWRPYGPYLGPLFTELGALAPADAPAAEV